MRTISALMVYGFTAILIPVSGCLEINVKTSVASDGSSERIVSLKTQTHSLPERGYPLPADSSWMSEWKETGEEERPYLYTARKFFATPEELVAEYAQEPGKSRVRLTLSLEKSFEWFYTYFDYREEYTLRNSFQRIPVSDYLTPEEIEKVRRGEKDDSLGRKVEAWDARNVFEEYYGRLLDGIGAGDSVVNRASLENVKEEMFRLMSEDTSKNGEAEIRNTLQLLGKALHTDAVSSYEDVVGKVLAEVDSMNEARNITDRWVSSIVMPGLLVSANGDGVEGNAITWKFEGMQLLVVDFPMEARSRVTNVWAFIVTGFAGLLIFIPAILRLFRRKS